MRRITYLLAFGAFSSLGICTADAQNILGGILNRIPNPSSNQSTQKPQPSQPAAESQGSIQPQTSGDVAGPLNSLVAVVANYGPDGKLQKSNAVHNLARPEDCNSYVNHEIRTITAADSNKDKVFNSTLITLAGNTGYIWLGCVSESDFGSPAFSKYLNTPMTKTRVVAMRRSPVFNYQEPADSQRGKKIRM